jgi:hypothetical protein
MSKSLKLISYKMRILVFLLFLMPLVKVQAQPTGFRAPSYPLITHDPYFSIWLNDEVPTRSDAMHWTQKPMPVRSMVRIDGKVYRLLGKSPAYVAAATHSGTEITALKTTFSFIQDGVELKMGFLSPLLVGDLDLVSRPVTYVNWEVKPLDGKKHTVEIYFDISGNACINQKGQVVHWESKTTGDLQFLKMGTKEQPVLKTSGDDVRIDWGYLYLAATGSNSPKWFAGRSETAHDAFATGKQFPVNPAEDMEKRPAEYNPVLATAFGFEVPATGSIEKHLMVAYDDIFSVEYFGQKLEGYWKKKFSDIGQLLETAEKEYAGIKTRCNNFDAELLKAANRVGGEKYAAICILAHRQSMAAHKVVKDVNGEPLCFSKENFSNGSMGTVDVFYPASPYFLYLNPELMKAQTTPIFDYAESGRWPWPYAPHDIGKYPLGNGQTYGGGELTEDRQMPVEECGNMLILAAAIAEVEENADYAKKYWGTITKWAEYLKEKGFDPDNQLCTDDFAGHLAHNANLSVKAIMGIASYARLAEMQGLKEVATEYNKLAAGMVKDWVKAADDGDYFRLAFDKPGTWSQKYNMVWDDILRFNLFDEAIVNKEVAHYLKVQNRYGLPLDSRETYTKLDWILWTASMANNKEAFNALTTPVYDFLHKTPDRVPMTDWYWTKSGEMRGFIARSVVGGVYMELLKEKLK